MLGGFDEVQAWVRCFDVSIGIIVKSIHPLSTAWGKVL